jgi:hypothetical protein
MFRRLGAERSMVFESIERCYSRTAMPKLKRSRDLRPA